jgi:hypothetical protein
MSSSNMAKRNIINQPSRKNPITKINLFLFLFDPTSNTDLILGILKVK